VSLLLTDGPAEEFEEIILWVTEVSLIPVAGNPVVLYHSQKGWEVDLLELRDEDFLLTVKKGVPAGLYEKIRLRISGIEAEGGPCTDMDIKLPSGKIDLNPRGAFEVIPDGVLSIRLDIDANKSIHLHPAGKGAKCIFRPVVFVDIRPGEPIRPCPRVLGGTIVSLIEEDGKMEGFILDLSGGRGELEVRLDEGTVIWNEFGEPSGSDALAVGQDVKVRGRLDAYGRLHASLVVAGDVFVFRGKAASEVVDSAFLFTPDPGTGLLTDANVEILKQTLILVGCDDPVGPEAIREGMGMRVFGWISDKGGLTIRAAAVLLGAMEIVGEILSVKPADEGVTLGIMEKGGGWVEVFVAKGTPIYLEGDGALSLGFLCEGRQVRVFLDPELEDPLVATQVRVQAEGGEGEVEDIDVPYRMLVVDGRIVYVQPGATILDTRGSDNSLIDFEEIEIGDRLEYFGLEACSGDGTFDAFVVVLLPHE
jgi:hypothetical protein